MENKKYELLQDDAIKLIDGTVLYRIKALKDFGDVRKGQLGGYIQKEKNLSHENNAWVYTGAKVYGNAEVYGNAIIFGNAVINNNTDYIVLQGFGSESRPTTFVKCKDNKIEVKCGWFEGTLDEFISKVKETHGNNKYAKEYLTIVDLVKIHFEIND